MWGHMNIRGPQLFYSFFHMLDESSSYWRTICGLELCFIVFVFNNQCFDFTYCVNYYQKNAQNLLVTTSKILQLLGTSSLRPPTRAPPLDPAGGLPWRYITCTTNCNAISSYTVKM